jgi:hypothetical protein
VEWKSAPISGRIEVSHARLSKVRIVKGRGKVRGNSFDFPFARSARMERTFGSSKLGPGPESPLVTLRPREDPPCGLDEPDGPVRDGSADAVSPT